MADQISVQPSILNLELYAGDGVSFRMICKNSNGAPVDITGVVKAYIRLQRTDPNPPVLEFTSNMVDAYQGVIRLSLTGAQTQSLMTNPSVKGGKFSGVWDAQWVPNNSEPYTLCQGTVGCVSDVTR